MKRKLAIVVAVLLFAVLPASACGKETVPGTPPAEAETLTLSATSCTLRVDETLQVTASADGVVWASSAPSVVTVQDGLLRGVAAGTATVTAFYGEQTASVAVTVTNTYYPVLSVLNKAETLFRGRTYTLSGQITEGGEVREGDIAWSSSDTSVVSIEGAQATAVEDGDAVITASATYNGILLEDSFSVRVVGLDYIIAPESLRVGTDAPSNTRTLMYEIYLDEQLVEEQAVITVDDPLIASVSGDTVTGLSAGETTLTVTYGTASATVRLEVVDTWVLRSFETTEGEIHRGSADAAFSTGTAQSHATYGSVARLGFPSGSDDPSIAFTLDLPKEDLLFLQTAGYDKVTFRVYSSGQEASPWWGINWTLETGFDSSLSVAVTEADCSANWLVGEIELSAVIAAYDDLADTANNPFFKIVPGGNFTDAPLTVQLTSLIVE